jgi:hypothetical protein
MRLKKNIKFEAIMEKTIMQKNRKLRNKEPKHVFSSYFLNRAPIGEP